MSWLTGWYNGLGLLGSAVILALTIGVLLAALAQHWLRYLVPFLWLLLLALGPFSVLSTGGAGEINTRSIMEVSALPLLLAVIPFLGWKRQHKERRVRR